MELSISAEIESKCARLTLETDGVDIAFEGGESTC
jgi:hypothetical protein